MEQIISLIELKELLPNSEIFVRAMKGGTGKRYVEIKVKVTDPIPEKEHEILVKKIIACYGEDLLEVFTEETGSLFYVYLRMSSTYPTTIVI